MRGERRLDGREQGFTAAVEAAVENPKIVQSSSGSWRGSGVSPLPTDTESSDFRRLKLVETNLHLKSEPRSFHYFIYKDSDILTCPEERGCRCAAAPAAGALQVCCRCAPRTSLEARPGELRSEGPVEQAQLESRETAPLVESVEFRAQTRPRTTVIVKSRLVYSTRSLSPKRASIFFLICAWMWRSGMAFISYQRRNTYTTTGRYLFIRTTKCAKGSS